MEKITSKENQWVKEYTRLSVLKSCRRETGRFAVEGVKLVCEAFQSGIHLPVILVTQRCLDGNAALLDPVLSGSRCCLIADSLESKLTGQKSPQGIYAIGESPELLDKRMNLVKIKSSGRYVMLCGLQDAGNVGTIVRTAEAFGVSGLILTGDTCDLWNPKTLRGSMGSVFRMPVYYAGEERAFLSELRAAGVQICASLLSENAASLTGFAFLDPCVLLIGNEGKGLSEETAALCTHHVTIPMMGKTESLNASMAAGILLWEMMKQSGG